MREKELLTFVHTTLLDFISIICRTYSGIKSVFMHHSIYAARLQSVTSDTTLNSHQKLTKFNKQDSDMITSK